MDFSLNNRSRKAYEGHRTATIGQVLVLSSHRSRQIKNHGTFLLQNANVHTLSVFEEEASANTNTSITNAMGDEEVHNEK